MTQSRLLLFGILQDSPRSRDLLGDGGWLMASFNEQHFHEGLRALGLTPPRPFVQDNHSCSHKGVLRELHFQRAPWQQGKLVRVVRGAGQVGAPPPSFPPYMGEEKVHFFSTSQGNSWASPSLACADLYP